METYRLEYANVKLQIDGPFELSGDDYLSVEAAVVQKLREEGYVLTYEIPMELIEPEP